MAVGTAVLALIDIGKKEATLGNVVTILEDSNSAWGLMLRDHDNLLGAHGLAKMMRLLSRGHASRHGSADYEDASIEEARPAVMLAAMLVQWLALDVVTPKA